MTADSPNIYQIAFIGIAGLFTLINGMIFIAVKKYMKSWDDKHDKVFNAVMNVDKKVHNIEVTIHKTFVTKEELKREVDRVDDKINLAVKSWDRRG